MKVGSFRAFRGLAIFMVVTMVLLALKRRGLPDFTGFLWWGLVLGGSGYLAWKGWKARNAPHDGPGGWGAVMPPKLSRWMLGENEPPARDRQPMDKRYIGIGIALGVVFGAATDHVGLGLALGIVLGAAIGAAKARRNDEPSRRDP